MVQFSFFLHPLAKHLLQLLRKGAIVEAHAIGGEHLPGQLAQKVQLVGQGGKGAIASDIPIHLVGHGIEVHPGHIDGFTRLNLGQGFQD